jgi:hypothetical protein
MQGLLLDLLSCVFFLFCHVSLKAGSAASFMWSVSYMCPPCSYMYMCPSILIYVVTVSCKCPAYYICMCPPYSYNCFIYMCPLYSIYICPPYSCMYVSSILIYVVTVHICVLHTPYIRVLHTLLFHVCVLHTPITVSYICALYTPYMCPQYSCIYMCPPYSFMWSLFHIYVSCIFHIYVSCILLFHVCVLSTPITVSYICVLHTPICVLMVLYMCPPATVYLSSYYYMCVLIYVAVFPSYRFS